MAQCGVGAGYNTAAAAGELTLLCWCVLQAVCEGLPWLPTTQLVQCVLCGRHEDKSELAGARL
jgi:hypothetical protein